MFWAVGNSPLIHNDYRLWLHKRWSAVVIQRHIRGFLACILYGETMLTNANDGSPSLLEDESSASPSLLSISADATAKSMRDIGYHFPEAVKIPSKVAVAKSAINVKDFDTTSRMLR